MAGGRSSTHPADEERTPAGNPLPEVVHLTVLSTDADDRDADDNDADDSAADATTTIRWLNPRGRLIVVGDVHGCTDALDRLLAAVSFDPTKDNLALTGDLVTKGPDSVGAVERAMRLGAVSARGNHDDLAVAAGSVPDPACLPDFVPGLTDKHIAWLSALPFTLRFPEYRVTVAHAGLVPGVPRAAQALRDVTRMRELVAVGGGRDGGGCGRWRAVEEHVPGSVPWAPEWRGPGHVLFGHDSPRGLQRTRAATGLDTACATGGVLTCAVLPSLEELRRLSSSSPRGRSWDSSRRALGPLRLLLPRLLRRCCCCCCEEQGPTDDGGGGDRAPRLPRTPRFERDLRGALVSVPSII